MSLVQEALDKIQEYRSDKERVITKSGAAIHYVSAPIAKNRRARKKFTFPLLIAGATFAAVALILASIFFLTGSGKSSKENKPAKPDEVKQNVVYRIIAPVDKEGSDGSAGAVTVPAIEAKTKSYLAGMPKLVLNGIMYIEGNPRAIVNGYTVSEGDSVSGAMLKEIRENSVVFSANGVEIIINLE